MDKITVEKINGELFIGGKKLGRNPLYEGEFSKIVRLGDDSLFKIFNNDFLQALRGKTGGIEEKILDAKKIENVPEILVPNAAVLNGSGVFRGYTMDFIDGQSWNEIDLNLTLEKKEDLHEYAKRHKKLEDIVIRGNKEQIFFPDLCTLDNLLVDKEGNYHLIDYDGLQVRNCPSYIISSSLGAPGLHDHNSLYTKNEIFRTQELDKKSLLYIYFSTAFNVNLSNVGQEIWEDKTLRKTTFTDVCELIGLDDKELIWKAEKTLSPNEKGEFIGEDVERLAHTHQLIIEEECPITGCSIKKLTRR